MNDEDRTRLMLDILLVSFQLSHDIVVFLDKMLKEGVIPQAHTKEVGAQIRDSMVKGKAIMEAWEVLNKE